MIPVIEIGSHSVKCLRGRRDDVEITRLAEGLARTGRISPKAAARTLRAVGRFLRKGPALIVATHALRAAENRAAVLKRWGLEVAVLSPEDEAIYSFLGATDGLGRGPFVTVDVGGGSTEIVSTHSRTSVPIGAATLTERPRRIDLSRVPWRRMGRTRFVAVGGTAATLAALSHPRRASFATLHGKRMLRREVADWLGRLEALSIRRRCALRGMDPGRADIMPAGLRILLAAINAARVARFTVSTRGVRHGVALTVPKGL